MNKKFTFMVAALLAAGGFSANAALIETATSGKYYHIFTDANSDGNPTATNDYVVGITETTGTIAYSTPQQVVTDNVIPANAKSSGYIWKVDVRTDGATKYVTLTNALTNKPLAVDVATGALVDNVDDYKSENLITEFTLESNKLTFQYSGAKKYIQNTSGSLTVDASANNAFSIVEAENTTVSLADLQKLGTGVAFDLDGTISGEELLNNVSFVTITNAGSLVTTSTNQFLLQVGKADITAYNLSDATQLAKFAASEFIVLTNTPKVNSTDENLKGIGLTYAKVKGSDLISAVSASTVVAGKYPVQNAIFVAEENANKAGKYAIKHYAAVYVTTGTGTNVTWTNTNTLIPYVGFGGNMDNLQLTSSKDIAWGKFSLGTAVDVKTLVKGQWIVNILGSENQESTVMKSVVYSKQEASATPATVFSGSTENTEKHKDAVYAQWVVSANADNTVTFINRETGAKISNITLFKTPKANVYVLSSTGSISSDVTGVNSKDLNTVYVELRTVENTTQFDGYLNLGEEGLANEYSLSVDASTTFEEIEANVIASVANITKTTDEDKLPLTFKLAPSKTPVDVNTTKLDTVFVKPIVYNYYKDGKLTEAKDTLKAISYNFSDLKNADKQSNGDVNNTITNTFTLAKNGTSGKFILRKSGDRYQIVKAEWTSGNKFGYDSNTSYVALSGTNYTAQAGITNATSFALNPVAVAPSYAMPESHVALEINGAYLGVKADGNSIMTSDTSMLKSTAVDAAFSFYAFSADKEEAKTPSYYLSSNGKMMYNTADSIAKIDEELAGLSPVFDAEKIAELEEKKATYFTESKEQLLQFQQAKYVDAEHIAVVSGNIEGDALKAFKFNVFDFDGQAVLRNVNGSYVTVLNDAVVLQSNVEKAAKFNVVAAEAPTSNESVSASEVSVVANNGSVVVKNAAGKNVIVSTILGQVVANEVLTSDNATINVPAGIVVVAVEGESFKVNVK